MMRSTLLCLVLLVSSCHSFSPVASTTRSNLVVMEARRGKGGLKKNLDPDSGKGPAANMMNGGKGQEITGVSLPADGTIKGWEFGGGVQMTCANVGGQLFALQGTCPRCAFDLFKGDLIQDDPGFEDLPRVACPTCSTTYGFRNGKHGPPLKRKGLTALVGNLAATATQTDAFKDAKAFKITREEDGRVYCRDM